jgi:thioesterase-3
MFDFDKDKVYARETESRVVIRFQDCDPLRHLNNAKYFDYFFNAREDQVPKLYGLEVMDFYKAYKAAWVVYQHQIAYIRPAMVGEWVRMMSRLIWFNENTIVIEYAMTNDAEDELKTVLWSIMKYIDVKTGKKTLHEGKVLDFLKASYYPGVDYENLDINQRIGQLKQVMRKKA